MTADRTLAVADGRSTLAYVRGLLAGRHWALAGVVTILFGGAALGLVVPWGFGAMVDTAIDSGSTADIARIGIAMAVAALGSAVLTGLGVALSAQLFETALARLREDMVGAALALPQSRVEEAGSGDLVSRATDDVEVVSEAIATGVPMLSRSAFTVVVTAIGFAALDWRFLAVIVVIVPVYWFAMRMFLTVAPPVYRGERAAMARRAHHVLGAVRGLATVHAFGLVGRSAERIDAGSWGVVKWSMRARITNNRLFGRLNFAEFLGMATIVIVGFLLVDAGSATVGAATTAMLLFLRLFDPIAGLLLVMDPIQSGAASLSRIVGVIGDGEGPPEDAVAVGSGARRLQTDAVTFRYHRDARTVLHEVSIVVEPGETVAVVGSSGAGKTTLAALLAGIHEPESGTITVGDVDLRDLAIDERPVLVTQEVHVFSGPLIDDLRLTAPDATPDQVRSALEAVGAWEWVALLPDGLETVVGAGGHALTPMREQQIALARLMLLDPPVVIFDEATADADSADADVLEDGAQAALEGRTALVIAHRLTQAARADRILVMEGGRIVENGTHDALRRAGGRYAELWSAWSRFRG
ncbi:ABC transporter ATP-binding protein [Gordonia hydrophobica]|uniref:ABC transporter ATP-binding protein n=1 Tax=Gordonia hydrophobica TaxID=40516 RepID=A0ABZ2U2I2_9ACTN|nr:ABC transporter ATP-binding protein [Gordonia hydrophobica]MBM7369062.1 ATP-binding cassette subfamily C protein [Gordonia hydrophobica]